MNTLCGICVAGGLLAIPRVGGVRCGGWLGHMPSDQHAQGVHNVSSIASTFVRRKA